MTLYRTNVSIKDLGDSDKIYYNKWQEDHDGAELLSRDDLVTINYCAKLSFPSQLS